MRIGAVKDPSLLANLHHALGPGLLGLFENGVVERCRLYHSPLPRSLERDAPYAETAAAAFAKVHAHRPPNHVLDVAKRLPQSWPRLRAAYDAARAPETEAAILEKGPATAAAFAAVKAAVTDDGLGSRLLMLETPAARARVDRPRGSRASSSAEGGRGDGRSGGARRLGRAGVGRPARASRSATAPRRVI